MTQAATAPTLTATQAEDDGERMPENKPRHGKENLVRTPKGVLPDSLRRYQEARKAGQLPPQWTRKTLAECINRVLRQRNGKKMEELAESIVEKAIEGNAACLAVIVDRFAPLEREQGQGRTVFEGIKLEVVGSSDGQRTTIALVRGSESHVGCTAQDAPRLVDAEPVGEAGVSQGVILDRSESQE